MTSSAGSGRRIPPRSGAMATPGRYNACMSDRSQDWLDQALRNLDQAVDSAAADRHEWACFASQQAAEMAVKAVHLSLAQEAWAM